MKKKALLVILLCGIVTLGAAGYGYSEYVAVDNRMTQQRALERAQQFVESVNANKPEQVYQYLSSDIRCLVDEKGFVKNFAKERSYPYLTPLYLYVDSLTLTEDRTKGELTCIVAARLPGQTMSFNVVFEEGDYFIEAFRDIADGSYLEKFSKL